MTSGQSADRGVSTTDDWPTFALTYTYNPTELSVALDLDPDELVVFAPGEGEESWLTAERGSYTPIEDIR